MQRQNEEGDRATDPKTTRKRPKSEPTTTPHVSLKLSKSLKVMGIKRCEDNVFDCGAQFRHVANVATIRTEGLGGGIQARALPTSIVAKEQTVTANSAATRAPCSYEWQIVCA